MAEITLHHPVTGNTITVGDDRVARVHEDSGWVRTAVDGEAIPPERPGDDAPPRKWLRYAAAVGLDIDPDSVESPEQLREVIDVHLAGSAVIEAVGEPDTSEDTTPDDKPKRGSRKGATEPDTTTESQED